MKQLTVFSIILCFTLGSQAQNTYDSLWKQVETLENEGLPKSALTVVNQIETLAEREKNTPQQIKTLLFKSKYALTLEEEAQLNIINRFKVEIETHSLPAKAVLENMLATLYWQYFQQNRWKFYNRTKTENKVDNTDFRTWDLETLFEEIHCHFQNSLSQKNILQSTPAKAFDAILIKAENAEKFRPTLYDILAHNALLFYKTDENSITKPAYKFSIDNADFFASASSFSKLAIVSKDSTSLQLNALKLYRDLTNFHLKNNNLEALVEIDIERLNFLLANCTLNNKEVLFLEALEKAINQYEEQAVSGLYAFEKARILQQQGVTYNIETNPQARWKLKEVLAICENYISSFPESRAAKKFELLKTQILSKQLQITAENLIPSNKHSKVLVRYKNFDSLTFSIYPVSFSQVKTFEEYYREDEKLAFIKKLTVQKKWDAALKNEFDYQFHTTELSIPKLSNGYYILTATANNETKTFATKVIQVTDLAITELTDDLHYRFQVINRNNGKPVNGANIRFSYQKNYNENQIVETYTTDKQGFFTKKKEENERLVNVSVQVKYKEETAQFGNFHLYHYQNNNQEKKTTYQSFLFTDRSIYRPGQTVHFKAIAMKTENGISSVLPNENVYATLLDTNDNEIEELELKTNAYGSVSGSFVLPNSGLTGEYYIEFDSDSGDIDLFQEHYFSVEEYKRPKFETSFNPVTDTFRVNDTVTVNGNAKAYAGSFISNAKVIYHVYRKVDFPVWYYGSRPWFNSEPQEIAYGETTTDDSGQFYITFKALPDQSVPKENSPVFHYHVSADVTDINGETRSATTRVNVGYHTLTAQIQVNEKINKTHLENTLTINTKNLNGEFVPATGMVKIYKLRIPQRVLRQRPWNAPDYPEIPKDEFLDKFPHEAYGNEHDSQNWEKGDLVFEKAFNTEHSKELSLGNIKNWKSGQYLIELESKDKFGQSVKSQAKTFIFSDKDSTLADKQLFSIITNKSTYKPNQKVHLTLGSSAKNLVVTVAVEKNKQIIKTEIISLNNNKKTFSVPVTENDYGGFAVHYSYAFANSFVSGTQAVLVPFEKTDLEIETSTFRDKLKPGQEETWSFKIKGPKGEQVSAELLASMYDMSLDQFKAHGWNFNPLQPLNYNPYINPNARLSFSTSGFRVHHQSETQPQYVLQQYDQLNWFGLYFGNQYHLLRGKVSGLTVVQDVEEENMETAMPAPELNEVVVVGYGVQKKDSTANDETTVKENPNPETIQIRKNLQETAFFFPHLQTDTEGNVTFSFTTPEVLTQWKLQLLAHTKTLGSTLKTLETVTQKELMVLPNAPRFLRHGDQITLSTKIANLSDENLSGKAEIQLLNAVSGEEITTNLINSEHVKVFSIDTNSNTQISWRLTIPDNIDAIQYKIIAKAGNFSDGEQNMLPVLSNRILVTETLPMWVKSNETRTFTLDKLKTNSSTSLTHHKLILEITSNPAWYAVQALPYLMEYPYDCNEQVFGRYYANALASHITNNYPRIQEVFNQWRSADVLLSALEKNQDLKNILIQETPWLRDAQSETEQKKRIALLFDLNKMHYEFQNALQKLKQNQMDNGAWAWFNGGSPNRFITQHIIAGFGHLEKLGVIPRSNPQSQMITKSLTYLDSAFVEEYQNLTKHNKNTDLSKNHLSYTQLHYLYMRSFFPDIKKSEEVETIMAYYHSQIQKYWLKSALYSKGLMALISYRMNDNKTTERILKSVKENSITNQELGMYWKENVASWHWYQAPIETHALLIEVFSEAGTTIQSEAENTETIDNLKIWLLKNKQTNKWETTKATTEAVYALLLQGSDWLSVAETVDVMIGNNPIAANKLNEVKTEAGTGYYKTVWEAHEVKPEMANVTLTKKNKGIAWGSLYWQYFEDLDKITSAETPLKLQKKIFKKKYTATGEELSAITAETELKVGDLVRIRIELRSDRDMEFVHMKDMRAAGLEPINVLSGYKWQDGLGYYESTKDASTNFFFDFLPKGIYVFEYDLRVNNAGNMSNGITTIQSMYAPEFSSHSEGQRISVKE